MKNEDGRKIVSTLYYILFINNHQTMMYTHIGDTTHYIF